MGITMVAKILELLGGDYGDSRLGHIGDMSPLRSLISSRRTGFSRTTSIALAVSNLRSFIGHYDCSSMEFGPKYP